jgi:hypothetical protein
MPSVKRTVARVGREGTGGRTHGDCTYLRHSSEVRERVPRDRAITIASLNAIGSTGILPSSYTTIERDPSGRTRSSPAGSAPAGGVNSIAGLDVPDVDPFRVGSWSRSACPSDRRLRRARSWCDLATYASDRACPPRGASRRRDRRAGSRRHSRRPSRHRESGPPSRQRAPPAVFRGSHDAAAVVDMTSPDRTSQIVRCGRGRSEKNASREPSQLDDAPTVACPSRESWTHGRSAAVSRAPRSSRGRSASGSLRANPPQRSAADG